MRFDAPLKVLWLLTRKCNLACPFCFLEGGQAAAGESAQYRLELARTLADSRVMQVVLSGGEPTLVPELTDIIGILNDGGARVVLIDPAAQGGHRETDLAMLALFGCPHLDAVYDGYQSEQPLRAGWRDRVALHQLFPLLAHVALFGAGYAAQTRAAARGALRLS